MKELKSQNSGACGFACLFLFGLVFFLAGLAAWFLARTAGDRGPNIVGIVFSVIGFGIILLSLIPALRGLKIRPPVVTIPETPLTPGQSFPFSYTQEVKKQIVVEVGTIKFLCRESATYQVGTDTRTDTFDRIVAEVPIEGSTFGPGEPFNFTLELLVPPNAMPTFESMSNKIQWLVIVNLKIEKWPDVGETFSIPVVGTA